MGDSLKLTVRPLGPNAPAPPVLEGAFRLHILVKDLEALGLKNGDICQLNGSDGNTGLGIAWRSTVQDAKSHLHPVKLTYTLLDAYQLKPGHLITVQRASSQRIIRADRVVLVDVTDSSDVDPTKDDNTWQLRCAFTLSESLKYNI